MDITSSLGIEIFAVCHDLSLLTPYCGTLTSVIVVVFDLLCKLYNCKNTITPPIWQIYYGIVLNAQHKYTQDNFVKSLSTIPYHSESHPKGAKSDDVALFLKRGTRYNWINPACRRRLLL